MRRGKRSALAAGARDFLTKPLDIDEVLLRMTNMLDIRTLTRELSSKNADLEDRVSERTKELADSYLEMFERLALAAEYRDDDTGQHTRRVGRMASLLGRELGLADESSRSSNAPRACTTWGRSRSRTTSCWRLGS